MNAADQHQATLREIDLGTYGAKATWAALSAQQRRVMWLVEKHGPRLIRFKKEYIAENVRHQMHVPIYVSTIRPLCARDLLAWDGGALDPEAAIVLTERGQFMLRHGQGDVA